MSSPSAPIESTKPSRAAFTFILAMIALDFLSFGIIAPVLPDLVRNFEGGDFGRTSLMIGYFGFAWNAMQFVCSPILGAWSDRFGRRPVILLSCFGFSVDYIFMALAPSLRWLFVGRLISGITASNVSTAFAYVTDTTTPDKRAKAFGLISAAFGLGFVIGPVVGGLLGSYNLRYPFWAAAALSLINALYGFFVLPESLPKERRAKSAWHMANPLGSLKLFRSHPELAGLAVVITLYYLAHQSLISIWAIYTEYRYAWNSRNVGLSLGVVGISAALVSGILVGPYVKKFGERVSLASGLIYGSLGFLCFGLARQGWVILATIPFIALWGIAAPAIQSLMAKHVDHSSQGKLQGGINSLRALTGMAGPILYTQVFAAAISPTARIHLPGAPYLVAATLLTSSLLLSLYVTRASALSVPSPATNSPAD
ncbi:MAG TPA: TCR/Tet family MFS transporter [Candidatus Dormibacteraeota bacterium]|nr:TCR/Tet family MFS transporter [Candidatus Dormibacteraeota bacterium]